MVGGNLRDDDDDDDDDDGGGDDDGDNGVGAVGHQHILKSSDDPGVVQD